MKTMHYKDYAACIEYSDEDGLFVGRIADTTFILTLH